MVSFINKKVWHLIMAVVLALSMIIVSPVNQASAADMAHQVTNLGDKSFTVTWVTDATATGSVNYGTSADNLNNTAYDNRGQATEDDTHHVPIAGLTASTPYYYEIVSGGVTYNNGDAPYEVTTGPTLEFKMPVDLISGTAYKEGGVTAAEGTIIYVSIDTSQILSVLVGSSGAWAMFITSIRAGDYQSYYSWDDSDNITIEAQGGADGTASQVATIATAKAGAPAMTLATALTANFSTDVTAASVGETIQFTNATSGGTPDYIYEWDFDNDGTVDSIEASPTHAYTSTGTYTVSLTVTDSETSTDTETKTDYISVAEELVAGFSADVTAASVGGTIQFTDATTGGAPDYTYEWDFNNDGTVDNTEASPTHAYTSTGTYTVSLTVTDFQARTDTETKTDYINVAEELVAGFSADLTAADTGDTIQFTDATTGGAPDYSYEWDFNNDGTVDSIEASPTYAYTSAGTYTVSLTVTDSQARTDTETKTDYINIIAALVAGFSADATVANVDGTIQFTDATTGGTPDYSYEWDFNNDGTVDNTEASPTHAYTSIGTYTVSLTVTDSQARTDTETKTSYINVAEGLVVGFSADITVADVGDVIQFTSAAAGGTPDYSYEWDFDNDGTVDNTEANPSHTYTSAGTYSVSLTVTDSQARTYTEAKTDYINAAEELVADFSADITAADVGGVIQFTDATSGGSTPYIYEWDFDNDGTADSTEASPTHTYTTAGTYTVSLTVTDSLARTDTEIKTDYISAAAVGIPHQVTNVGDKSFTIAWVTNATVTGYVNYGTSASSLDNTAYDERGQTTEDDTHHVTITDLSESNTYCYEIISGGVTYNNGGAPYEVTTGPTLEFKMPVDLISGKVYKTGGVTAAEGIIVYVSIGTSQVLSTLVDSAGTWAMFITSIRAGDYQSYYSWDDSDNISTEAQGGADGMAIQTATISTAKSGALTIELTPDPIADFSADLTAADAGGVIQFTDATTDGVAPYAYEWDFNNDGTADSTEANPSHTYTSAGTYTVSLTVTDSLARTDTETKTGYISITAVPTTESVTDVTPSEEVVEEIPPDRTADELEEMDAEEAAGIIEEVTTTEAADIIEAITTAKAADIIEEVTTTKAVNIIEEVTTTKAVDIIEVVTTTKAVDIIEEVTTTKAADIIEAVTTTKAVNIIEAVTTTKAADIIKEVTTDKAAAVMEELTTDKAANIIEVVTTTKAAAVMEELTTDKAADVIEVVTTTKAADIIEEVTATKAADIIEEVTATKAANVIEVVTTDKAADIIEEITTDKAVDIIEEITTTKAADIIEVITTTKAVDIIEVVTTDKAADVIEVVTTDKAADIIEVVTTDKAADIIEVITTDKAANIIEVVTTGKAADIIEEITTDKAAAVMEELTTEKAANIIEVVATDKAAAVMEELTTEKLTSTISVMSETSLSERLPGLSPDKLYSVEPEVLFDSLPNAPTEQLVSEELPQPPAEAEAPIAVYTTPSGATYLAIQTWAGEWVIVMGTPPPVDQLMIKTKQALKNVETSLEVFEEQPSEVAIGLPADQIVRAYISITFENASPEDIELGHMTFKVEKEWLEQNSVHKWSVTLSRYDPESAQWIALPTKRLEEDNSYVYYTVAITHFSFFAISGSQALPPPNFEVANLAINPVEAKTGEDITISADITNLSNTAGTYAVTLWIDGTVEAGKNVSLEAGATTPVSFNVIRDVVGTYEVRFDRLFGSFNVIEATTAPPKPPFNWWLIIGIIAGVIVITTLIYIPLRKRNQAI